MARIPVVIVDDQKLDRRIAKRRLSDAEDFGKILEAETGSAFLERFFNGHGEFQDEDVTPLILMDINMPGLNGFETIEEMQKRMADGRGPESVAVMMVTSSENPADRARAEELPSVIGYSTKPMDADAVSIILEMYRS